MKTLRLIAYFKFALQDVKGRFFSGFLMCVFVNVLNAFFTSYMVDEMAKTIHGDLNLSVIALFSCLLLAVTILYFFGRLNVNISRQRILHNLRTHFFASLHGHTTADLEVKPLSYFHIVLTEDIIGISDFLGDVSLDFFSRAFTVIGCITMIVVLDWRLAGLYLFLAIISIISNLKVIEDGRKVTVQKFAAEEGLNSVWMDIVHGMKVIKQFMLTGVFKAQVGKKYRAFESITQISNEIDARNTLYSFLTSTGSFVLMLAAGLTLVTKGISDVGPILAICLLTKNFMWAFRGIPRSLGAVKRSLVHFERLYAIDSTTEKIDNIDPQGAKTQCVNTLRVDNLSFHYPNGKGIDGFSAVFMKDEISVLKGASGAGKSTIIKLLLGLYESESGEISADDILLSTGDRSTWLAMFGYVAQNDNLLPGTLFFNIALGESDIDYERVKIAAKKAGIHDVIENLPEGYDTRVESIDDTLSGGERQRLSLARVYYRDAAILLMDEPISAVDKDGKREFLRTLKEIVKGRIVILCAHDDEVLEIAHHVVHLLSAVKG